MENQRLIGSRIKQLRKKKGLSQTGLATFINKSAMQVSYIENGERKAGPDTLERIAKALDVTVGDFLAPTVTSRVSTITYGRMSPLISVDQKADVEQSLNDFDNYVRSNLL